MLYINGRFISKTISGVSLFARQVIKTLDKKENKNKITILIPKNTKIDFEINFLEVKQIGKFKKEMLWEQISLVRFMYKHKNDKLLNLCNSSPIFLSSYIVIHDIGLIYNKNFKPFLFTLWYKFMFRITIKRAKMVYTVSNFCKKDIVRYYKIPNNKIEIAYNGYEQITESPYDDSILEKYNLNNTKYFLSVASNLPHKNLNLIVNYAKNHPNINFVFVIDKNIENVTNNITMINKVSFAQLKSLYKNAYCFILASCFEGFGIPPLEAIMSGCKRILLSDIEVFKEIYGNCTNYFDLNKEFYIPESLKEISEKDISELKNKYSWSNSVKCFQKLL